MIAWRGIFGAGGVAALAIGMQGRQSLASVAAMRTPAWMFVLLSATGMILFIHALRETTVAHVAVLSATVPMVAAVMAWVVLRERPSRSSLVASGFALCGVSVMVGLGAEGRLLGDVLAFGMTVCMAGFIVMARHYRGIPTMPAACLTALLSAIVAWPLGDPLTVSGSDLLVLALFGLVNSALGMALFTYGARMLPAMQTALIGTLDAPLAPLWVWLMFQETPSVATLVGGALVMAAVAGHLAWDSRQYKR